MNSGVKKPYRQVGVPGKEESLVHPPAYKQDFPKAFQNDSSSLPEVL